MNELIKEMLEKLSNVLEPTYFEFDHEDIDKFVSNGVSIAESIIFHSFTQIRDWNNIKTKHGFIGMQYSPYLPDNTMIITKKNYKIGLL